MKSETCPTIYFKDFLNKNNFKKHNNLFENGFSKFKIKLQKQAINIEIYLNNIKHLEKLKQILKQNGYISANSEHIKISTRNISDLIALSFIFDYFFNLVFCRHIKK